MFNLLSNINKFAKKSFAAATLVLTNQNGATSVLVIFMLIVLVALGSFAITSANVNMKLGTKTVNWNGDYYKLDKTAEDIIASIDYYLYKAELETIDYIKNEGYLSSTSALPSEIQTAISASYSTAASLEHITNQLYLYHIKQEIEPLKEKYNNLTITDVITNDFLSYKINDETFIEFTINGEDIEKTNNINLTVHIKLLPIEYSYIQTEEGILSERITQKRYKITSYKEWQTPFDYNSEINWYTPEIEMEIIE